MHFRTAELSDSLALADLVREVAASHKLPFFAEEVNDEWAKQLIQQVSLRQGLMIVAPHPHQEGALAGVVCGLKNGRQTQRHVLSEFLLVVHPAFTELERAMLVLFLDEVVQHRPDIGKVELMICESEAERIHLLQSVEFMIEGRLEMRRKNADRTYEADIALSWQNPAFEFDQP